MPQQDITIIFAISFRVTLEHMHRNGLSQIFAILATGFLIIFLVYPLFTILSRSFESWQSVSYVLNNPYYLEKLKFSFYQAVLSTILTVALALPSAVYFAKYQFAGKRLIKTIFTIPFVMPTIVAAIGFLALIGPNGITGVNLKDSFIIILIAHIFYNYALVLRIVSSYLESLGNDIYKAADILGASQFRKFWQISLPLALPAIVAAATLTFIFCFTSFGVIVILAAKPEFATLEVEIYRVGSSLLELEAASVLALVQLIVITLASIFYTRLQAKTALKHKQNRSLATKPNNINKIFLFFHFALAAIIILSPLIALTYKSFFNPSFSFDNFKYLLTAKKTISFPGAFAAIKNSLLFAFLSSFLSLFIGFAFAYAVVRGKWRFLDAASLLPLATSSVTLGFGYLIAFPSLRSSIWGLVLAHTVIAFPLVSRSILPALRSLPDNLINSAKTLGKNNLEILWQIELPLLIPSFITAASFAFAISMGEFGASLTIISGKYATIPVAIFDRLGRPGAQNYGAALALSFVLMLVTTIIMLGLEHFGDTEF